MKKANYGLYPEAMALLLFQKRSWRKIHLFQSRSMNSKYQVKELEASINQTEWIAYHPDREEIWNNIKQKLNV